MTNRTWACACCIALLLPLARETRAQLIPAPVKTRPIADGDQLGFLPSANFGMAGVSMALADTMLDPFTNPARAARVQRSYFFGSPSFYSVSGNTGGGRTLPLGIVGRQGALFGGLALAIQDVSPARDQFQDQVFLPSSSSFFTPTSTPSLESHTNQYAFAMLGRDVSQAKLSFAASAFWSRLTAMDGVDLLYPGSQSIRQSGDALDMRVGMLKEWGTARSLEAVVLHNSYGMTHDVSYEEFFWDPVTRTQKTQPRVEHNLDRASTTGLQLKFENVLADSGWRIGTLLSGNRATHPIGPSYGIIGVVGDRSHSSSLNVGAGVAKAHGPITLGVDAIYEPIWTSAATTDGSDSYRFSNTLLRTGISREFKLMSPGSSLRLQAGMQFRSVHYTVDQIGASQTSQRSSESWNEWMHSWGASVRMPDVDLHFQWRVKSGMGRPGFDQPVFNPVLDASFAPFPGQGPMILSPVRVTTLQFSVSVPMH